MKATRQGIAFWGRVGLGLAALAVTSSVVWAVEVTGSATFKGEGEAGKQAAIRLALRDACEKGCGVFLASQKNVPNRDQVFSKVVDQVITQTAGFVSDYQVKRADFLDDSWSVVVAANVSPERFADAWKLTYIQVNSPRLMVVVTEERDGQPQSLRSVQAAIEQFLLKKGFRLVDKSQFTEVKEARIKEAALADDLASAASVARDFGAELLVVGQARAEKGNTEDVAGMAFQFYVAEAVIKVVQTDSGTLVVSERPPKERAGSREAPAAAAGALEKLGERVAARVWKGCVDNWEKMVAGAYRSELHVSGVTPKAVLAIEAELKKLQGVTEVNLRRLASGAAQFDIVSTFSAKELFTLITESKALANLDVTGISQNVIQARWKEEV
jgi:hypothetical protein